MVHITVEKTTKKAKKEDKIHNTDVMVTINSNESGSQAEEKLQNAIHILITENLYNNQDLSRYVKFNKGSMDDVIEFKVKPGAIEYGSQKMTSAHVHILFRIKHKANIHLDLKRIVDEFKEVTGFKGLSSIDNFIYL